ncbi:hypothetical protein PTI98_013231 [Pleurotus ostreatus]|nr:hypothetical protein PTI98_013231 [Pleurotus ostreatus]
MPHSSLASGSTTQIVRITSPWTGRAASANQTPDSSNFVNGGGMFYVLFKHRGQVNSTLYPGYENFKLRIGSGPATPTTHTPNHSTKNGDEWTATIDYEQSMQMFKNNGNETFTHGCKVQRHIPIV